MKHDLRFINGRWVIEYTWQSLSATIHILEENTAHDVSRALMRAFELGRKDKLDEIKKVMS